MCTEDARTKMDRRDFLRLSGTGLAAAAVFGTALANGAGARPAPSLESVFKDAAAKYGVPEPLLKAMGYVNTRWSMPPKAVSAYKSGDIHGQGIYGMMALEQNPSTDTLGAAAELTGMTERRIKTDRAANVMGAAAVLGRMAGPDKPDTLEGWQDAVAEYGGGGLYVADVYHYLREGAEAEIASGEQVELSGRSIAVPRAEATRSGRADYSRATWYGPASDNYTNSNREASVNIKFVIIHIAEGYYAGTIDWCKTRSSDVSAHYVVRSRDGAVAQLVRNEDIAWHAGHWQKNRHSIGIEHEGFANNKAWYTGEMYRASARLTAWCCKKHRIRVDRDHIIGHREVPGVTKSCPGRHWDWERYMKLVRHYRKRI